MPFASCAVQWASQSAEPNASVLPLTWRSKTSQAPRTTSVIGALLLAVWVVQRVVHAEHSAMLRRNARLIMRSLRIPQPSSQPSVTLKDFLTDDGALRASMLACESPTSRRPTGSLWPDG